MATRKEIADAIALYKVIQDNLQAEINSARALNDIERERQKISESINERQRLINDLKANENKLTDKQKQILSGLKVVQEDAIKKEKEINKQLEKQVKNRQLINTILSETGRQLKEGWKFLMEQDKVIKSTILNLGLSGTKAELMRGSFEQSAGLVARMGGSLEDVQKIMEGYADETGRARVLSASMVTDIEAIGRGTGLGVEQATRLGAQFEMMGLDARRTNEYVQGIVDTSERMGVNTTKVLKNLNDNFKKINTFTFLGGSKALAQMAMNAERTKVNMASALNVAEAVRGLDKVIELTANLQVMGGEFAKIDPFQMWYLGRNEPDKLIDKISEMTSGIATFKKQADGTFEAFISGADRDRLASVAESLGIAKEEIFEIAKRKLQLNTMDKELRGMGLTDREKKLIQGAAIFNNSTAKFQVSLAGQMKDISTLTAEQARSFAKEQVLLKDRALEAQTFDEAFKATINELKSALLPILRAVNVVLAKIRPVVIGITEWITKGPAGWAKVAGLFMATALVWKAVLLPLTQRMSAATIGKVADKIRGGGDVSNVGGNVGGGITNPNAGKGLMRGGAGIGAAAAGLGVMGVGIGEGINLAASGISKLADSMSKLTPDQAKSLQSIAMTLAIAFPAAAVGITAVGLAGEVGAIGILAVGAALVGVGFGIKLATDGIGKMAEGLAKMNESGGGAGRQLLGVAGGIGAITLAMGGGGVAGLFAFNNALSRMAKKAPAIELIGKSFEKINTVMSGNKEDYIAVADAIERISKINTKGGSLFSDLKNMLNKPLQVEFKDKQVALNVNTTLNVSGTKFHEAASTTAQVTNNTDRARRGYETSTSR